jgi:hypothetical protein
MPLIVLEIKPLKVATDVLKGNQKIGVKYKSKKFEFSRLLHHPGMHVTCSYEMSLTFEVHV